MQRYHKLISDYVDPQQDSVYKIFTEDINGTSSLAKFEATLIQTDIQNRNGRNYPKSVMMPVVERYIKDRIIPGAYRSFGELGHPEGVEINPDRISHFITEMRWEGHNVVGKCQLLASPNGKIADVILKSGCKLGVSTRGMGALDEEYSGPGDTVAEFNLVAIDIVVDPSAPQGWIRGICEGKKYICESAGIWQESLDDAYKSLDKTLATLPKKDVTAHLNKALTKFFEDFNKPI